MALNEWVPLWKRGTSRFSLKPSEAKWQELINQPAYEDEGDLGGMAEEAQDAGIAHYEMLAFLKRELLLGGLAGMYQLWERTLRSFLEQEMRHWMGPEARTRAWKPDIEGVFELLTSFGWNVKCESFFNQLDACRLVVNAHKHGKGAGLNKVAAKFPVNLRPPFGGLPELQSELPPEHDDVMVSEDQFMAFAKAIGNFWEAFPKQLSVG